MLALGHKRTLLNVPPMSALPPKADIAERHCHVRFVPKADIPFEACGLISGCSLPVSGIGILSGNTPQRELEHEIRF